MNGRILKEAAVLSAAAVLLTGCQKKKKREKSLGKMHGNSSYRLKVIGSSKPSAAKIPKFDGPGENSGLAGKITKSE